jgi:predicted nucleic acid-binding protein
MMVLDTNVVSELMRLQPDPSVLHWIDGQDPNELWLSAVVAAELMYGVARLPIGKRKEKLALAVTDMLEQDFAGRVLPFDLAAASVYADIAAQSERSGKNLSMADAQIAASCLVHGASLVTRNVKDFAVPGLTIINPWGLEQAE